MSANAHLSTLNLMAGIQYTYTKGNLRPSLAIGPVFSMDLNSQFDMEHILVADTVEIVQDFNSNPINGLTMGAFAQLGVNWTIRGPHQAGCDLRYYFTRQRTTYYINRNGISLSLYYTYTFKL